MQLPIGYDNFRQLIDNQLDFVDKSLLIKEILDDKLTQIIVITRPRRFGKTMNLSMLQHFLAADAYGHTTESLFQGLKIMEAGQQYIDQHRQHPVIFITFKDVKHSHFTGAYANFCTLMSQVYFEHRYLLDSTQILPYQKELFQSVLKERATEATIRSSLFHLTQWLFLHHGKNPWLLIDEYDTPVHKSYVAGFYDEMMELMDSLLGKTLKTNPYLHRAVISGMHCKFLPPNQEIYNFYPNILATQYEDMHTR